MGSRRSPPTEQFLIKQNEVDSRRPEPRYNLQSEARGSALANNTLCCLHCVSKCRACDDQHLSVMLIRIFNLQKQKTAFEISKGAISLVSIVIGGPCCLILLFEVENRTIVLVQRVEIRLFPIINPDSLVYLINGCSVPL